MESQLDYFHKLYEKLKFQSLCLDIETTKYNGPISIIGFYRPNNGEAIATQLIKNKDLTTDNIREATKNCKLFITYNGFKFDIPKIKEEFGDVLPKVPILDLYLFAKKINYNTNLKVMESTFGIDRPNSFIEKRGIAIKLWNTYTKYNNIDALNTLLKYNAQDAINLYPLAEDIMRVYLSKKDQI